MRLPSTEFTNDAISLALQGRALQVVGGRKDIMRPIKTDVKAKAMKIMMLRHVSASR